MDWSETDTRHRPGIPADVMELLDPGAEVIVLTQGMDLMLHTSPATTVLLHDRHIEVIVAETQEAVRVYDALAQHRPAGALLHSTC